MAGRVPAIHELLPFRKKTWMPGTRPGMTIHFWLRGALRSLLYIAGNLDETAQQNARPGESLFRRLPVSVVDEPVVRLELHAGPLLADEGDQPFGVGEALVAEGQDGALRPGIDLLDA